MWIYIATQVRRSTSHSKVRPQVMIGLSPKRLLERSRRLALRGGSSPFLIQHEVPLWGRSANESGKGLHVSIEDLTRGLKGASSPARSQKLVRSRQQLDSVYVPNVGLQPRIVPCRHR